jgi:hypothetical protein
MTKLNYLWIQVAAPRNRKVIYLLLALAALAIAGGAPSAGSGMG